MRSGFFIKESFAVTSSNSVYPGKSETSKVADVEANVFKPLRTGIMVGVCVIRTALNFQFVNIIFTLAFSCLMMRN